jgi:hypothetical protein
MLERGNCNYCVNTEFFIISVTFTMAVDHYADAIISTKDQRYSLWLLQRWVEGLMLILSPQ